VNNYFHERCVLHWKRNSYSVICALIKLFCTLTCAVIDEKDNRTWVGTTQTWGGGTHHNLVSRKNSEF